MRSLVADGGTISSRLALQGETGAQSRCEVAVGGTISNWVALQGMSGAQRLGGREKERRLGRKEGWQVDTHRLAVREGGAAS